MALAPPALSAPSDSGLAPPVARSDAIASGASPHLAQALNAAWARSLEAVETQGHQAQAQAELKLAGALLAGPLSVGVARREGWSTASAAETELDLFVPLWRWGQRRQQVEVAHAETDWARAAEQAARLRLAGLVREQAAGLRQAEDDAVQTARQRQLLDALSNDVERRVRAGDLATADALAAKAEALAARVAEQEAGQALASVRSAWGLLTGLAGAPLDDVPATEAPGKDDADGDETNLQSHALARLAEAAVQRARQRVAKVQAQRGGPPELGLGVRQERSASGQSPATSLALSMRLPIGGDVYNQPQLAAALAEESLALAAQQRLRLALVAELALAREQLTASQARAEAEAERAALLRERARLIRQAFDAGESPLPDVLRALSAAAQAEAAASRQQASLSRARHRLQQAMGQLP